MGMGGKVGMFRQLVTVGWVGLMVAGIGIPTPVQAGTLLAQLDWLNRYQQAWQSLSLLPHLQFRQQVRMSGSQTFTATLDVLARQDGSWQAWVSEGNRVRLLDSSRLEVVGQSDILRLYSVYVSQPEALLPSVTLNLQAPPGQYQILQTVERSLNGEPVQHLTLAGEGQLRELWLDPLTALPRQALLYLSGVWGQAYGLLTFTEVEGYWLPQRLRVNMGYGFWTLSGLSRRDFVGSLTIEHEYQDYQILPEDPLPRFAVNVPPVDRPPTVAGSRPLSITADQVRSLGRDAAGNEQFSVGLGGQSSDSPLQEKIATFNLTRPGSRNPQTHIDTLALLGLGPSRLPIYLFQFHTGEPLSPIQPGPQFDPRRVSPFRTPEPGIRIL